MVCVWSSYDYSSMLWFMFLLIFFFKQKTAYEMRMSDWSSDVCSSDLAGPICWRPISGGAEGRRRRHVRDRLAVAAAGRLRPRPPRHRPAHFDEQQDRKSVV